MNIKQKIDELPRVPALLLVGFAFLAGLTFLLLFSGTKLLFSGAPSGDNLLPALAPVPPPANFVDRSGAPTMRVDGLAGELDREIILLGGTATIKGKVVRPGGGPTAQRSTVELARWEGERFNAMRVTTDFDGTFEVKDLRGGRWSGRGWEAPQFPSREAAAWFVSDGEALNVELTTGDEVKNERRVAVSPEATTYDTFTVTVFAVDRRVDEAGRLVEQPVDGAAAFTWPVNYEGPLGVAVRGGAATVTGRCASVGAPVELPRRGSVKIGDATLEFAAPQCIPRPEPTTTTTIPEPPPTIAPPTTTTLPPSPSTTVPTTIIESRVTR